VRVLVVDDEPLARAGLRAILREERDLSVVGESAESSRSTSCLTSPARFR
jgi:DNA-binding NarL/FixJ family response regulator